MLAKSLFKSGVAVVVSAVLAAGALTTLATSASAATPPTLTYTGQATTFYKTLYGHLPNSPSQFTPTQQAGYSKATSPAWHEYAEWANMFHANVDGLNTDLYCIDIETKIHSGANYNQQPWDANVPNAGYIAYILNNYYPKNTSLPAVNAVPNGVTGVNAAEFKAAAVQAAIWFFSDGFVVSAPNEATAQKTSAAGQRAVNSDAMYPFVKAIVEDALANGPVAPASEPSAQVTPASTGTTVIGQAAGPFTITHNGDSATLAVNGAQAFKDAAMKIPFVSGSPVNSGDVIYLSSSTPSEATLTLTVKASKASGTVWVYDGNLGAGTSSQKLILAKSAQFDVTASAKARFDGGGLTVLKKDRDNQNLTLAGAEFDIYNADMTNVLHHVGPTGAAGTVDAPKLLPGTYWVVETKAPATYDLDSTAIQAVVKSGESLTVTALDDIKKGHIEVTKVDRDDPAKSLAGAEFVVKDSGGNVVATLGPTGADGKVSTSDLKPGTYWVVETKAPADYNLDSTPIQAVVKPGESLTVTALDDIKKGNIEVTKADRDNPALTLAGAEFDVYNADMTAVVVHLGPTDANGEVNATNLKPGTYWVVESKAPVNYDLDATPIKAVVGPGQNVTVTALDSIKDGKVTVLKVDAADHNKKLAGAEFDIKDPKGKVVAHVGPTDANGAVPATALKPGKYALVETKAPVDYFLNAKPVAITVQPAGSVNATVEDAKIPVAVLGETISNNPVQVAAALAHTGTDMVWLLLVGAVLAAVGTAVVVATPKVAGQKVKNQK